MATFTKELLTGSTNGRQIKVAATATPGTLIHTAHASNKDEIWLWASNTAGSQVKLTIEWGGTTDPDDLIEVGIPGESGRVRILEGEVLTGGVVVRAYAATGNVVTIGGYVNRIS
jgi:hypothetical protein